MRVLIWTGSPNHYQHCFLTALRSAGVDLQVCYYAQVHPERLAMGWHDFKELPSSEQYVPETLRSLDRVSDWSERVHIVAGYHNIFLMSLIVKLSTHGVAWVHWSERSRLRVRWWATYPLKRWHAYMVNRYALGAFAIGSLATVDFSKRGIRREKIAFLPYSVSVFEEWIGVDFTCEKFCEGRPAFLFVGSLCPRKGLDILLYAFAQLSSFSKWVLIIVGDDRWKGGYLALAKKLGIASRVLFRGVVKASAVASVYKAAKVLVLPSRADGWGVVLNEAASMGLALIASDQVGSAYHIIDPGENGFCVQAGSVKSLWYAMGAYVADPCLAERHGKHSLQIFKQFTPERNAERFVSTIHAWQSMQEFNDTFD